MTANPLTAEKRFWGKVDKADGCWNWTAHINRTGYGCFDNKTAHRVSYAMTYGDIPDGLWVLHKCDNRKCVRPDHLFLGTAKDNTADMINKGRARRGTRGNGGRITDEEIAEIRRAYAAGGITQTKLGEKYSLSNGYISRVINRLKRKQYGAEGEQGDGE